LRTDPGGALVRVAVDAQVDRPERTFTYRMPAGEAAPGSLLLVRYGARLALGYLLPGDPDPVEDAAEIADVEAVISDPLLTPDLLALAEAVAVRYRAPIGLTLAAMLPPGLESRLERRWEVVDPDALGIAAQAGEILTELQLRRHGLSVTPRWIEARRRGGAIRAAWRLRPPTSGPRSVLIVRRRSGEGRPVRGTVQNALLDALGAGESTLPELAGRLGRPPGSLRAAARSLAAAGWVDLEEVDDRRDPLGHREPGAAPAEHMAHEQATALAAIRSLPPGAELLLQGVAASGKTDVILAAVEATVASGEGALVLVPEVALIPQVADRLRGTVGSALSVLHSGLSVGERHDEWQRILAGAGHVVVGTRSAVFAPVRSLGLVVLDEAHEPGYKSDRAPRYDTRWVARERAALTGARLVLATATPDVVMAYRVRTGVAQRAQLADRRVGARPTVTVVDMRAELADGNRSVLSATLAEALAALPGDGSRQAILLINRRGASTFVLCRDCGEPLRCRECQLPLVHHLATAELRCHHDGRTAPLPSRCPICGSRRIRYFGAGTQRVEAEVRSQLPRLRVARLDSDALSGRRRFETIYDDFVAGRTDVLVGTQVAAKGLDLPSVVLAGVVAADVTLHLPDYLAAERTFQLLAQVAGRAGRGPMPGRVVIQTYAPQHSAIQAAARLDADGFIDEELPRRQAFGYPPFGALARLLVADADRRRGEARANAAAEAVSGPDVEVLGPVPAWVPRRAGRWRWQIVIRTPDEGTRADAVARAPAGVGIDVDPGSLL